MSIMSLLERHALRRKYYLYLLSCINFSLVIVNTKGKYVGSIIIILNSFQKYCMLNWKLARELISAIAKTCGVPPMIF